MIEFMNNFGFQMSIFFSKKKEVKNTKKLKKQIVNDGILKMFCILNIYFF